MLHMAAATTYKEVRFDLGLVVSILPGISDTSRYHTTSSDLVFKLRNREHLEHTAQIPNQVISPAIAVMFWKQ
jgi:hypothetical protein